MRKLMSIIRVLALLALAVFLIGKYAFGLEPTVWLALGYPFALLLSWLFYRLLFLKRPNYGSPFIENIFMDDWNLLFRDGTWGRWRNIWHFRNYRDSSTTTSDKLKAWILRIVVLAVIAAAVFAIVSGMLQQASSGK